MTNTVPNKPQNTARALILGGIIPVVIFTLVEEYYGTLWGLVAGMVFGVGEILYEKITRNKVDGITWIGNGLLIGMGAISLFTNEGIWFKLQPAIIEVFMAGLFIGSVLIRKPFLLMMAKKQNMFATVPDLVREHMEKTFSGLTFRIGLFFLLHAVLATWAALHWSTRAWAILKGVGFTGSLFVYMGLEIVVMKLRMKQPPRSPNLPK